MKWTPQKTMTLGVDLLALARQLERVADEVGDLEDLRPLVVVRQDDGVALALERADAAGSSPPGGRTPRRV